MQTRRLLWLMSLAFSLILLVQYIEVSYGYVMSSLLSSGKTKVAFSGLSNETRVVSGGAAQSVTELLDEKKSGNSKNSSDSLGSNDSVNERSSTDFLEMNLSATEGSFVRNESVAAQMNIEEHFHNTPLSRSVRNSLADSLHATNAVPSSPAVMTVKNKEKPILTRSQLSTSVNSSAIRRTPKLKRFKGAPARAVAVPISEMNDLLSQSRVSYHSLKARWPSRADKELLNTKKLIESADSIRKNPRVDVNVYRNFSEFTRSYELMEQTLKIYIYNEGERPIFHQPELKGIYASEGWFMKLLKENKHFVTKNGDKAHLFYLPFSSLVLRKVLHVPGSHDRTDLVQYLSSYLKNITSTHHFWNRTSGADHFLVACHDWAPAVTDQIMNYCIRALCNANVKRGFQFGKDVSLPTTYVQAAKTPLKSLGGKPPSQRHILAFFAGSMHGYLRPILLKHWENKDPDMKITGKLQKSKGEMSYTQYMKSSKYCISAKGYEAHTPRVIEAIFHDCVPVILSDNYIPPFFETLNWESFAVFILEKDIPNLKKILTSIPEKRYIEMQKRVKQVQKHFLWHHKPVKFDVFHMILHSLWYTRVLQVDA